MRDLRMDERRYRIERTTLEPHEFTDRISDIVGTLVRLDTRLEGHVASVERYHCRKFPMPARRMSAVFHPSFTLLSATIPKPRHTSVKWNAMMTFNFPDTLLDDGS
jgi:hypothetical protein